MFLRSVFGGGQGESGSTVHGSTRAYEDQSFPVKTGYQPNMETGIRSSSLPLSSSRASGKYQAASSSSAMQVDGQSKEDGKTSGPARKRASSALPDRRPPRAPPAQSQDFPIVPPLTPELVGANVSFPDSASTGQGQQSPMDADQPEGEGTVVYHDIATPPKTTGMSTTANEENGRTINALPFGQTECSGRSMYDNQQESGAAGVQAPKGGKEGSSSSLSASLSAATQQTPAKKEQEGGQEKERNLSKTPPRLQRDPTPPAEGGSSSGIKPAMFGRVFGNEHQQGSRGSSRISSSRERGRDRQSVVGHFNMPKPQDITMNHRGPLYHSREAGSVRSHGSSRSHGSQSVGHLSNGLGLQCWNKQDTCAAQAEYTCGGHQGLANDAGQKVTCNRPTCRNCATDCDLTGCHARFLCSDCASSPNHRCGYVVLMKLQEEIQAKSEAHMQKKLVEQNEIYQAQLSVVVSNAQQTQSQANAAITSIKAELDNTVMAEEETRKAALRFVEEQNRVAAERAALQAQEQREKWGRMRKSAHSCGERVGSKEGKRNGGKGSGCC